MNEYLLLHLKVKWMNKEITWPGTRKLDRSVRNVGDGTPTLPSQDPSSTTGALSGLEGMVANYVKKKVFLVLLLLLIGPGCLCAFWLLDPPNFAADYRVAFQALCGMGLLVSIVIAAILNLWLEDKLRLK